MAFDTLAAARRLKKVGMEESHAEAVAESLRDAVTGSVATKQDLDAAKAEVKAEIAAAEARLREENAAVKAEIAAAEARLREEAVAVRAETKVIKWLLGFLIGLMLVRTFEIL